jgi:RES domain-containing protein
MEVGLRLWRLTRSCNTALTGEGAALYGGRYSPPGVPVIPFASEPGLAVLVALRYLPQDRAEWPKDYCLGWTETDAVLEILTEEPSEERIRENVSAWLLQCRSLLVAITSKVLPEANVILMNPRHPDFASVHPLQTRPFDFEECLHRPPMLDTFRSNVGREPSQ